MDLSGQFCPNFYCSHRGKPGLGNIRVHSRTEQRYRCTTCGKTFAATRNTPYYRLHKPIELVTAVLALLSHGCPIQAIVAAFSLDERTVADWQQKAGRHGQRFHELQVERTRHRLVTGSERVKSALPRAFSRTRPPNPRKSTANVQPTW